MMQKKRLWMMVAVLSAAVVCWGIWVIFKPPHASVQSAESLQGILFNHIEYLPEVYRAHENYTERLHNDTCVMLVYRYSPNMCNSCYHEDLFELKEFKGRIERNIVLVLPAYRILDRRSRIMLKSEVAEFNFRNIPADSLALPIHADEGEKRYFAVIDTQGRVGMIFFPAKGRQDLTRRYFQEVERHFKELRIESYL